MMLCFTRRPGETIMIGDDIEIYLGEIKGQQTKIGIRAPKNISIHRGEIYDRILIERSRGESYGNR